MIKAQTKNTAIKLRKEGNSYNHIASCVGVSKSTLSIWLADIPYTPNTETMNRIDKARIASGAVKSRIKHASIQRARKEALEDILPISKRDTFMLGLGLYIGEGAKSMQNIRFANSNAFVVMAIIKWFIEALGLDMKNIRMRSHLYPDNDENLCIDWWAKNTGVPKEQFLKPSVDRRQNKKAAKAGKLRHGTAHVSVYSLGEPRFGVFLARKIIA